MHVTHIADNIRFYFLIDIEADFLPMRCPISWGELVVTFRTATDVQYTS